MSIPADRAGVARGVAPIPAIALGLFAVSALLLDRELQALSAAMAAHGSRGASAEGLLPHVVAAAVALLAVTAAALGGGIEVVTWRRQAAEGWREAGVAVVRAWARAVGAAWVASVAMLPAVGAAAAMGGGTGAIPWEGTLLRAVLLAGGAAALALAARAWGLGVAWAGLAAAAVCAAVVYAVPHGAAAGLGAGWVFALGLERLTGALSAVEAASLAGLCLLALGAAVAGALRVRAGGGGERAA